MSIKNYEMYEPNPAAQRHIDQCYRALCVTSGRGHLRLRSTPDQIAAHEANIRLVKTYVQTMRNTETLTRALRTVANLEEQIEAMRAGVAA